MTTTSCKHTFCRDCIARALKHNSSCPIDRSALTPSSLQDTEPLVQLMLDELKVRCEAQGCGKVMQRGLLLSHLKSCTEAIVTCGDDQCGISVRTGKSHDVGSTPDTDNRWRVTASLTIAHTSASIVAWSASDAPSS